LVDLVEMAQNYVREIKGVQTHGPYRLGGWSLGGVLAYEMARQLVAAGEGIEILCLLDAFLPPSSAELPPLGEQVQEFLGHFEVDANTSFPDVEIDHLEPEEGLAVAWRAAVAAELVPADLPLVSVLPLFAVHRANRIAFMQYQPRIYPGSIVLLQATEDLPVETWEALAQRGVETRRVPGQHFTMLRPPNIEFVAREIQAALAEGKGTSTREIGRKP
jgi:thioesterase domain-containing protein